MADIPSLTAEVERLRAEIEALKTPHHPDWPHCPCFRCAFVAEKEGRLKAETRLAKVLEAYKALLGAVKADIVDDEIIMRADEVIDAAAQPGRPEEERKA